MRSKSLRRGGVRPFFPCLVFPSPLSIEKWSRLDLRSNDIHDGGLDALAEGMECNASVERLFVWGNHFGQVGFGDFHLSTEYLCTWLANFCCCCCCCLVYYGVCVGKSFCGPTAQTRNISPRMRRRLGYKSYM